MADIYGGCSVGGVLAHGLLRLHHRHHHQATNQPAITHRQRSWSLTDASFRLLKCVCPYYMMMMMIIFVVICHRCLATLNNTLPYPTI